MIATRPSVRALASSFIPVVLFAISLDRMLAGEISAARPNIIVILVDDMGLSDIGCYGSEIPHAQSRRAGRRRRCGSRSSTTPAAAAPRARRC